MFATLLGMGYTRFILFMLLAAALAFPAHAAADARGVDPSEPNPLAGATFWNDPNSPAMAQWRSLVRQGKADKADLIWMPSQVTHIPPPDILADMGPMPDRGGKFITINGREVFRFAVRTMIKVVQEALLAVPLPMDRVWLVPHQVNQRIIDAAMPELPIPASRVVLNLDETITRE